MQASQRKLQEAITLHQKGELAQAKIICEEVLNAEPHNADALHLLGMIEYHSNNPEQAIRLFNSAININPDMAALYFNCGNALHILGRSAEAIDYYDKALNIKPDYVEAYTNRGLALQTLMKLQAAIESYNCALAINPNVAEVYMNRGLALQKLNQLSDAIKDYDHAITLNPNFAESYFNGGNAWQALSDFEKAIRYYDNAIRINANYADAYFNRALAFQKSNRFEQALENYKQAMKISPAYSHLLGTVLYLNLKLCRWSDLDNDLGELIKQIERGEKSSSGFPLVALTNSLAIQRKVSEQWANDNYPVNDSLGSIPKRAKPHKINIGYFSADFYHHPISILLAEVFELHDKHRFEVIAFSLGHHDKDTMQLRIEQAVDQFIDVRNKTDEEIAMLARQLNIDIAVDLGGATSNARTGIFAHRAAPIQVNYLGYPGTMGAPYFDYLIADKTIIPESSQLHYVEKIVYLPDTYQANDATRQISEHQFTRAELGLPEKGFIFCCLNNNYKITPIIFDSWMNILNAVADSVLFLFADNECAKDNLRKEAQSRGVNSRRLIFADGLPIADYLARYSVCDLFLNTFPYNAGTTASDALWAGLPVLTWSGETFVSRVTASLLKAIDLPELITGSQAAYEALAIELATDPDKLQAIKEKLADNKFTTPLFNTPLFTRHIEAAYTKMVERYQADLPPDSIYVESIEVDAADVYFNRGNAFYALKNYASALANYNQAIAINPDLISAYFKRGNVLQNLTRFQEAVDDYEHVINNTSNYFEAFVNCGSALVMLKQFAAAIENYNQAIHINPDAADILVNRGFARQQLDQLDAATADFERAITIKPDFAQAHFNLGNVFLALKQFEAAVTKFDTAIAIKPDYAKAFVNRGSALLGLKQKQAAIESFDSAIACQPDVADAYHNKALVLLSLGEFEKGWDLYDWRLKLENAVSPLTKIPNAWDGNTTAASLLVLPEQGMGDEIFFSGMLNDLNMVAADITACVDSRLIPLYQRSFESIKFISKQSPWDTQKYDKQIHMGSLGRFFRANRLALQNIKSPYLNACPEKTKLFRDRLAGHSKFICGLSWISKNTDFGAEKTLQLQDLTPILSLPDIEFVDLQYGDTRKEQAAFFEKTGISLTQIPEVDNFNDIDGLASLIDACDMVLTISNTTAHLAGALGKPVIIMLPEGRALLWYWHEGTGISPWYPTARLVKQANGGDWAGVVEQVKSFIVRS